MNEATFFISKIKHKNPHSILCKSFSFFCLPPPHLLYSQFCYICFEINAHIIREGFSLVKNVCKTMIRHYRVIQTASTQYFHIKWKRYQRNEGKEDFHASKFNFFWTIKIAVNFLNNVMWRKKYLYYKNEKLVSQIWYWKF